MKSLLITFILIMSSSVMASTANIQSVILDDGSILNKIELSSVVFNESGVDYLTLKDGSKIEGTEVKAVKFSKKGAIFAPQVRAASRVSGDGTGG